MTLKLLAVLFILVVLVVPNRISSMTFSTVSVFPVEFLLLGCVLLLPKLVGQVFRWLVAVLLTVGIFLKLTDIVPERKSRFLKKYQHQNDVINIWL